MKNDKATQEAIRDLAKLLAESDEDRYEKLIWKLVIGLTFALPIAFWRGYVFVTLWSWFLTSVAPAPTIYAAVGGMMVLHLALPRQRLVAEGFGLALTAALMEPAFALGIGWVWRALGWGM